MRPELVFRARLFSAALAFCAALGLAGRAGVEQARAGAREPQPAFAIRVLGAPVDDALAPVAAAHAIASAWGAEGLVLRCGERTLAEVPRGSIARIDEADLAGLITRARQPGSLLRRYHAQLGRGASIDLPVTVSLSGTP